VTTIGSKSTAEDNRKIAPTLHSDKKGINPVPFMDGMPGFNIEAMPVIDNFRIGATHAPNAQHHLNEHMSNSANVLSSIRIFDVNSVHEQ
jgi:hypothetical protein